jgi:hypothetical protein
MVRLPENITVVPMRDLAWRMGTLVAEHSGLSTLGSEAVAAAEYVFDKDFSGVIWPMVSGRGVGRGG